MRTEEMKKLLDGKKIGELKTLLPEIIFGEDEISSLYLDTHLDSNGYFTRIVVRKNFEGEFTISLKEGGCKKLSTGWVIHPEKWRDRINEKTFDSPKELEFIMNSETFKRGVSTIDVFYVDFIF